MPILVAGLINLETTLHVERFPLEYFPVRYPFFAIASSVSGVGFNLSKALGTLGHDVRLLSLIGNDATGRLVREELARAEIDDRFVIEQVAASAQSVILYDDAGRRQIHVDLKDLQDQGYPEAVFDQAAHGCSLAVLCNINFSRSLLDRARRRGMTIASDVHTIASLDDPYNADYMAAAEILFMSDERLPMPPPDWAAAVHSRYGNRIIVIGLGHRGALLTVEGAQPVHIPAVSTRPVINTVGAGDALFACFLHAYSVSGDAEQALRQATVFASYKIGATGAADGFLTSAQLAHWAKPD
jgi:acarbose 7IV-phosphotransferase